MVAQCLGQKKMLPFLGNPFFSPIIENKTCNKYNLHCTHKLYIIKYLMIFDFILFLSNTNTYTVESSVALFCIL